MITKDLFAGFFNSEKAGGVVMLVATALSLVLANSPLAPAILPLFDTHLAGLSFLEWVNDGLMTVFFLLIGLELEREFYKGELSNLKGAMLPVFAALGGMILPAGIYILFNFHNDLSGAGIPVATDIAFAIGILALVGNRVPPPLKIFLLALAIIDDVGAILVIALFYNSGLDWIPLVASCGVMAALFALNRLQIHSLFPYLVAGPLLWFCLHEAGIHPSLSGILLAFTIPFGDGSGNTASHRLQHYLHKPVAFLVIPLFAAANTCIPLSHAFDSFPDSNALGIMAGFVIGKPLGILLFSVLAIVTGIATLPAGLSRKQIAAAGMLGGIGFSMSIFITLLAFNDPQVIIVSKVAILLASVAAGTFGFIALRTVTPPTIMHKP
jgi:NhaA family Na+:H+ antiporter